jgi:hypothetical protein
LVIECLQKGNGQSTVPAVIAMGGD